MSVNTPVPPDVIAGEIAEMVQGVKDHFGQDLNPVVSQQLEWIVMAVATTTIALVEKWRSSTEGVKNGEM